VVSLPVEAFHGCLAVHHGHDDITILCRLLGSDKRKVAFHDGVIYHGIAFDPEKEGAALELHLFEGVVTLDVFHRKSKVPGSYQADNWDLRKLGLRFADKYNSSGASRFPPEISFFLKGLQMMNRAYITACPEMTGYLPQSRGVAFFVDAVGDKVENLLLPGSEVFHFCTNIVPNVIFTIWYSIGKNGSQEGERRWSAKPVEEVRGKGKPDEEQHPDTTCGKVVILEEDMPWAMHHEPSHGELKGDGKGYPDSPDCDSLPG
jgi:hypothetical protein